MHRSKPDEPLCHREPTDARGEVNLVSLFSLAALAVGIYALVLGAPLVGDNLSVKEAIAIAYNQSGRLGDEALKGEILERTRNVGTHSERDEFGYAVVKPGLGLTPEDIVIERDTVRDRIRIEVPYERDVRLAPTQQSMKLQFHPLKEGPIPK